MTIIQRNSKKIKGILSDLDGTIYFKGKPTPGAIDTILSLNEIGIKLLFFTNTDSKSPDTILKNLYNYGFSVKKEQLFTPIIALKEFLSKKPTSTLFLVTTEEVKEEFKDFSILKEFENSKIPDYVIIGDFHDNWDVNQLNHAFKYILKGAKLLGTQGNRYYLDKKGEPVLDTGSFVKMVATAAKIEPIIFGKPSMEYFLQALIKINLKAEEVIVIGDDIETDIQGAINAGLRGVLVRTGKGEFIDPEKLNIKPFKIIASFNEILNILN
jgi:HAD superfamily hydrolase (TIGR01458 family)